MSKKAKIEVSYGELIDKYTILTLKYLKSRDNEHIYKELKYLRSRLRKLGLADTSYIGSLLDVNRAIWDLEDTVRRLESEGNFGMEFVEAARQIYHKNDERFQIKNAINQKFNSNFKEQKFLPKYK